MYKQLSIIICVLAACSLLFIQPFETDINKGLFIFTLVAVLWMTEAIHLTATALLIPLLASLLGIFPVKQALLTFAHPIIFIFLGGFSLAAALQKVHLDRVIASKILGASKGHALIAVLLLFVITAGLSMWVSNTAITAVMLPLALGMIQRLELNDNKTQLFILLGIAYSASIGGMGSLVGSPPNAIVAAALNLTFIDWMKVGLPLVIVLLPLLIGVLYWRLKPALNIQKTLSLDSVDKSRKTPLVIGIFSLTVLLWLFSKPLGQWLDITSYFDALVALGAVVLLLISKSLQWKDIEKNTDWGVLMLFGGGLALSAVLKQTGTSAFIAENLAAHLAGISFILLLTAVVLFVIFLTELTSNTATAALLVPLFISIADQMQVPANVIAIGIGFAASCAFMLPVATPPNAIVYGSGLVKQQDMMKAGIALNLVAAMVLPMLLMLLL